MICAAAAGSLTPGSWIAIWSSPCVRISGSATPRRSTRLRMISTERSRSSEVSSRSFGGTACSVTSRPPCRSRPSVGSCGTASRERQQADADERGDDEREDDDCRATSHGGGQVSCAQSACAAPGTARASPFPHDSQPRLRRRLGHQRRGKGASASPRRWPRVGDGDEPFDLLSSASGPRPRRPSRLATSSRPRLRPRASRRWRRRAGRSRTWIPSAISTTRSSSSSTSTTMP